MLIWEEDERNGKDEKDLQVVQRREPGEFIFAESLFWLKANILCKFYTVR